MAVPQKFLDQVTAKVVQHCAALGYESGPNWNPLQPQDSVAALAMARSLVESRQFDSYLAVAPEGHVYGYFFEQFGIKPLSIFVDYPPRSATTQDDLSVLRGKRVLIIEDDVISGISLQLVCDAIAVFEPASISVYIGRRADSQCPENVPTSVKQVFLAESHLGEGRERYEQEFIDWCSLRIQ
jgi:hypothetical protein